MRAIKAVAGRIQNILRAVVSVSAYLGDTALILMTLIIAYEVIARYFFNNPTGFADEIAAYLLIAVVFLAAGQVLREDSNIKVQLLYRRLSRKTQLRLDLIAHIFGLFVWSTFTYEFLVLVQRSFEQHRRSVSMLESPLWIPQAIMFIGATLALLQSILVFADTISYMLSGTEDEQEANPPESLAQETSL